MQVLTEDYSKLAFLCEDRTLHFHAKFGAYHKTRIPRAGRDIAYASAQAELLVAASSSDIYRQVDLAIMRIESLCWADC